MKLIIELKDETYKFFKEYTPILIARGNGKILSSEVYEAIKNGKPYNEADVWRKSNELLKKRLTYLGNPSGDAISRSAVKANMKKADEQADTFEMLVELYEQIIDNAQAISLPNEQIAWEQGYEAGLAQAVEITEEQAINKLHETGWLIGHDKEMTDRPKGEWQHIGGDEWVCSECGHVITTEGSWENPLSTGAYHCENCGADMRKGDAE